MQPSGLPRHWPHGLPAPLTSPSSFLPCCAFTAPLEQLPKPDFVRAWCAVAYTFPGLHPDGYEDAESGWPRALRRFAAEAWRRADAGELADEELYPCDAQWADIYDRLGVTTAEENQRRVEIAAPYGERSDG